MDRDEDGNEECVSTGRRAVIDAGFRSLPHTFVSLCREHNAAQVAVEAIVVHSNSVMTRRYAPVSELAATQAVAALPVVTGDAPAPTRLPARSRDDQLRETIRVNPRKEFFDQDEEGKGGISPTQSSGEPVVSPGAAS
jgi:hypothetical protein